ncbi:hypothetical protein GQ457_05G023520 [Hibiscus cannabinus]
MAEEGKKRQRTYSRSHHVSNDVDSMALPAKLGSLGLAFKRWSTTLRKENRKLKETLEKRLKELESSDPDDVALEELINVKLALNFEADKEEYSWEQRARVNWLSMGDRNTIFFHNFAASRKKNNLITDIEDGHGRVVSNTEEIVAVVAAYFNDLFSTSATGDASVVFDKVNCRVTPEMNATLSTPFQREGVWAALQTMSPLKASGTNGFLVLFYKKYWDIIGNELEVAMNRFWWKNSASTNGIHWCTWAAMAIPKILGGMGFQNLSKFNVALLAKQGWRIINHPSSLLAKVMKARYFPNSDFLSAQLGSSPSYTWRSIVSVKGLLEEGLRWRIGTGSNVADLITPSTNTWDVALVKSLFTPTVVDKILCIPLAKSKPHDELVWGYEGNGCYSPKSGYRLLLELDTHITLLNPRTFPDYKTWLTTLFNSSNKEQRILVVITYWALWFARNQLLHEGKRQSIAGISAFIGAHIAELNVIATLRLPSTTLLPSSWSPPALGIIKFNFDTSFILSKKEAFSGVIARNSSGLIMAACILAHVATDDAFIAEARACEAVLNFAIELGFKAIHVEGDSLTVIKKLISPKNDKSIIRPIISDIQSKLGLFEKITFFHVGRQENEAAHVLAQAHHRFQLPYYWIEDAPLEVEQAALRDLRQ